MADEVIPEVNPNSMESSPDSDNLNNSLANAFRDAGVPLDTSLDEDPLGDKDPKKGAEKPDPDPDPKKGEGDPDPDPEPEPKKEEDPSRAKGPLPKGVKPKSDPIDKNKPKDLSDPDTIKPPANISKHAMEGWKTLQESAKQSYRQARKYEAEITKINLALAEKSKSSSTEVENMKKELEELRGYRASFDHQFDPEFKKTYSAPMEKLQSEMKKILIESGVREDVVKSLDWNDSDKMDRVAKSLDEHVNSIAADRFRNRAKDYIELNTKKTDFLEEFKGKHKEFTSKRAQELEQKTLESDASQLRAANTMASMKDEKGEYRFPFLLKFDPQEGASEEEIKRVEDHNKMADVMRGRLQKVMAVQDPESKAQVAIAAVTSSWLNEQLKDAREELKSLREDLKKYNDLSSTRRGPQAKPAGTGGYKTPESLDLDDALESAFPGRK